MKKKLICCIIAFSMMLSTMGAQALNILGLGYWSGSPNGINQVEITNDNVIETSAGATIEEDGIHLGAGASVTWGFYIPFNTRSITIKHKGSANITISSGDNTYNMTLDGRNNGVANKLVFAEALDRPQQFKSTKYNDNNGYMTEFVEHRGEKEITITAETPIIIQSFILEKELTLANPNEYIFPELTDFENETVSSVIIDEAAPVIMVHGGYRYVDYNDQAMKPYYYNDSIYLPINTLAKALNYYHEDIPEKNYALLRSETHEVVKLNGECTVAEGVADRKAVDPDVIIHRDGKTLAAVRYFGELAGKTVEYRDGVVVIDDKYTVGSVINDDTMFADAKNIFSEYKAPAIEGNTYYVDSSPAGSDENDGGPLTPFKTITKAADIAKAGDTVIIHGGTYREILAPKNSGTATAPITFKAAEGEKVVISATESLGKPSCVDKEKNIYEVDMSGIDLGTTQNQIFINGEMQTEARYPNGPGYLSDDRLSNAWGVKGNIYKKAGDWFTFISDTTLDQPKDYWKGGILVGVFGECYHADAGTIVSSDNGILTVGEPWASRGYWYYMNPNKAPSYNYHKGGTILNTCYIAGHENAMDIEGEWIRRDDGTLRIILDPEVAKSGAEIEAKARYKVIDLSDKSYINVEGISTFGGSAVMKDSKMCMLNNLDMKYISHTILAGNFSDPYMNVDYPIVTEDWDSNPEGAPAEGMVGNLDSGNNNMFINCKIDHSWGAGILLTGMFSYVENNTLSNCGYGDSVVSGIEISTEPFDEPNAKRGGYAIFNNTVYNAGRSCMNIAVMQSKSTGFHRDITYMPMDIGWNDFHDGGIQACDGGNFYSWGPNAALEKQLTQVHHNYFYQTFNLEDRTYLWSGLYLDAYNSGFDTHGNVVFNLGTSIFSADNMELSQDANSYATIGGKYFNNHCHAGIGDDISELHEGYFNEDKPFFAGAKGDEEYLNNYNRYSNGIYEMAYPAKKAEMSEGVTISDEDGYATFTGDGQYLHFKDVDFGTASNEIAIHFTGDSNWTNDEIEVVIGDSIDAPRRHNLVIKSASWDLNQSQAVRTALGNISGKHDVWIKISKYYSARIGGISVYEHKNSAIKDDFVNYTYITSYNKFDRVDGQPLKLITRDWFGTSPAAPVLLSGDSGSIFTYKDRIFTDYADHFLLYGESFSVKRTGQVIKVYVDSMDSEPVAKAEIYGYKGYPDEPLMVKLDRTIEPGVHDIIVALCDPDGYDGYKLVTKTNSYNEPVLDENGEPIVNREQVTLMTTLRSFAFLKKGADTSEYTTNHHTWAGDYSELESKQDENKPFYCLSSPYIPPEGRQQKITNTLPGTVAAYDFVNLTTDCDEFIISYSADPEYDGQPVEVRVNSLDSEPIAKFTTKGEGPRVFNRVVIPLEDNQILAKGCYKVYLSFGGSGKQTFQPAWFCFNDNQTK